MGYRLNDLPTYLQLPQLAQMDPLPPSPLSQPKAPLLCWDALMAKASYSAMTSCGSTKFVSLGGAQSQHGSEET